ncbi:MAG: DUF4373 domain-containing protein [Bacteroidales bacterium]|nr:DUF4373 domain-containing protein [Bacteroidales bacterium]
MARPYKQGIDYFPIDTDFFTNRKVRRIIKQCGAESIAVLMALMCIIYKEKGYYTLADEDLVFDLSDSTGVEEGQVRAVIEKAVETGFFDKGLYQAKSVLSSVDIQKQYLLIVQKRKSPELISEYSLLEEKNKEEDKTAFEGRNVSDDVVNDVNNPVNVVDNPQIEIEKEKERKIEKETILPTPLPEVPPESRILQQGGDRKNDLNTYNSLIEELYYNLLIDSEYIAGGEEVETQDFASLSSREIPVLSTAGQSHANRYWKLFSTDYLIDLPNKHPT